MPGLFGKVYFPRLIVPLSIVVSNLIRFGVQMLLFFIMIGFYWVKGTAIHPNAIYCSSPFCCY
jgi:lipopolysaccharide transport system permease protein